MWKDFQTATELLLRVTMENRRRSVILSLPPNVVINEARWGGLTSSIGSWQGNLRLGVT